MNFDRQKRVSFTVAGRAGFLIAVPPWTFEMFLGSSAGFIWVYMDLYGFIWVYMGL